MHNGYDPATDPPDTMLSCINVELTRTDDTDETADTGEPEQLPLDETTNACASDDTFTSPTPTALTTGGVALAGITLGLRELIEAMVMPPTS